MRMCSDAVPELQVVDPAAILLQSFSNHIHFGSNYADTTMILINRILDLQFTTGQHHIVTLIFSHQAGGRHVLACTCLYKTVRLYDVLLLNCKLIYSEAIQLWKQPYRDNSATLTIIKISNFFGYILVFCLILRWKGFQNGHIRRGGFLDAY